MPNWTEEQKQAIFKDGSNILVSAGAGSGKTEVLSERALRKVKEGINIDEILILTFSRAAAYEMMVRIREKLKDNELYDQVNRIDKAYITTFDAFSLAIVKKYHDKLNITKDVSVVDENVISLVKQEYLDNILNEYYQENPSNFEKLITDFCLKSDQELKKSLLKIDNKLELKYDKTTYLENYIDVFYDQEMINTRVLEYENILQDTILKIKNHLKEIELMVNEDYFQTIFQLFEPLLESKNYDDIKKNLDISLPRLPNNSTDEVKEIKTELNKSIEELEKLTAYNSKEDMIQQYLLTKPYLEIIVEILWKLDQEITAYKMKNNIFEFTDISKLAIRLVKEDPIVCEEIKNSFHEIMIDEYQDTSDLQEEFIHQIEKNNVYMVGDIKQSIYRFRNANPMIFKNKYDSYSTEDGGRKIDLNQNFRSREEVIKGINDIFDMVMDDSYGGARYQESHQMVFGNRSYVQEGLTKQNYYTELYQYHVDRESPYQKYKTEEIEAFVIAKDIRNKIDNQYQIFDKKTKSLRNVQYQDFVILMDRSTCFNTYKKIFEYHKIPLTVQKKENIVNENEVYLLKNILILIDCICHKEFENRFRYAFTSIARSYLFRYSDQEIFQFIKQEKYFDTNIIQIANEIVQNLSKLDLYHLIEMIIEKFEFATKLTTYGNVEKGITVLEYFLSLALDLQRLGYDYVKFIHYLENIIDNKSKIEIPITSGYENSCKLMTIHTSKGLEFPICYYSGLSKTFNVKELNDQILFDDIYGIVLPNYDDGYQDTFYKKLLEKKYYLEEISEKIRLFYVALTRGREKMILIADLKEEDFNDQTNEVSDNQKSKYRSFLSILKSISHIIENYVVNVDLDNLQLTDDYQILKEKKLPEVCCDFTFQVEEYHHQENYYTSVHFSKAVNQLIDAKASKNMKFGTEIHELFQMIDFKNPNLDSLEISEELKKYIKSFLQQSILADIEKANIYKEYEFYTKDNDEKHGIIDLMLEYSDHIDIIDYKLKNVEDNSYFKQLFGYQKFIETKTNKEVNTYLYSIMDDEMKLLNKDEVIL